MAHHDSERQSAGSALARDENESSSALSEDCDRTEDNAGRDSLTSFSGESIALPRKQRSQDGAWHVIRYPDQIGSDLTCSSLSQGDKMQFEEAEGVSHATCLPRISSLSRGVGTSLPADNNHRSREPGIVEAAMYCPQPHVTICAEHDCQTTGLVGMALDFHQDDRGQHEAVADAHSLKHEGIAHRGCQASNQPAELPARSSQCAQTDCQPAPQLRSGKLSTDQSQRRAASGAVSPPNQPPLIVERRQERQAHFGHVEHSIQTDVAVSKPSSTDIASQKRAEKCTNTSSLDLMVAPERMRPPEASDLLTRSLHGESKKTRLVQKATSPPLQNSANGARGSKSCIGFFLPLVEFLPHCLLMVLTAY